jgi:cyclopropane fatty-acyl-phospholipid synthase-like methyltransferase
MQQGIDVLDIGCGSGRALNQMAKHYPDSRFTGYDLSMEAVVIARSQAITEGLTNVRFEQKDLSDFDRNDYSDKFDLITAFDAIHDQARPDAVLAGIARALKQDGLFLMQDIHGSCHHHNNHDHPLGPMLYTVSCMHCMTVSLAQNGAGLGAMWGRETAETMLKTAGFKHIDVYQLPHDIQNDYYLVRK